MKKALVVLLTVAIMFVTAIAVYSHCHDNVECEDNFQVKGLYKWPTSKKNSDGVYTIIFRVNPHWTGMPSLSYDVSVAAGYWSNVSYQGERIAYQFLNLATTSRRVDVNDTHNVVAWEPLGDGPHDPVALTHTRANSSTYEIREKDIAFNYEKPFTTHAMSTPGKHCIRQIATHELGHVAGLRDVWYNPNEDVSRTNCPEYTRYTMYGGRILGGHDKEHIECEDLYALMDKYGYKP